jgi:hypothetical protein
MQCSHCAKEFGEGTKARAGISILVMGDEYIYSYWFCEACDKYTVESYHDRFMGDDEVTLLPPVSKEVGDRCVELVRACREPFDKHCECASHKKLYYGLPRD